MPTYKFKALDRSGTTVTGTLDATDEARALQQLQKRKLEVFKITSQSEQVSFSFLPTRIRPKDLARYISQLATLLNAGVTLLEALESLSKSKGNPKLAIASKNIRKDLRSGEKLSIAIHRHLPTLPNYVPRLAELGEMTGQSAKALSDASERMEQENITKSEIRTALSYPMFLAVIGTLIVFLLFVFVVPRFESLIGNNRETLPTISKIVLGVGSTLTQNLPIVLTGLVVCIGSGLALSRQDRVKGWFRGTLEKLRIIGPVLIQADLGGWARTVGIALDNGADLLSALRLGETGLKSKRLQNSFISSRGEIRAGRNIDEVLAENIPDFDPLNIDLMRTGRTSGQLAEMLLFIGDTQEKETKELLKRLTALAEPIAILLISMIIGTIVIGIVLAMTSLYNFDVL